jgi:hypothetical protein
MLRWPLFHRAPAPNKAEEWLRRWRLVVSQLQLDIADCRETLRSAQEAPDREQTERLITRAREEMLRALREFEYSASVLIHESTESVHALDRKHQARLTALRRDLEECLRRAARRT